MQSEETAPVVRQADIRRLVIRIGTYTNKNTLVKGAHTHTHTDMHAHMNVQMYLHSLYLHSHMHTNAST